MTLLGARCHTAAHLGGYMCKYFVASPWRGFASSQVSQCCSLGLLCFYSCVTLLLTGVALCQYNCHTATHWSDSLSSQVSYCYSLLWILVFWSVPLWLTKVALHGLGCFTTAHWGGSMSPCVFLCHLLVWFFITRCATDAPMFTSDHSRYTTGSNYSDSAFV